MDPICTKLIPIPKDTNYLLKNETLIRKKKILLFTLLLLVRILSPKSKPRLINNRVMRIGAHAGQFACQGNQYNDQRSNWRIVKIIYMTAADVLHGVTWSNASLIALRFLLFPLEPSISLYLYTRFIRHDVPPSPPSQLPSIKFSYHPSARPLPSFPVLPTLLHPSGRRAVTNGRAVMRTRGTSANQHHSLRIPREPRPDPEFPRKKNQHGAFFSRKQASWSSKRVGDTTRWSFEIVMYCEKYE